MRLLFLSFIVTLGASFGGCSQSPAEDSTATLAASTSLPSLARSIAEANGYRETSEPITFSEAIAKLEAEENGAAKRDAFLSAIAASFAPAMGVLSSEFPTLPGVGDVVDPAALDSFPTVPLLRIPLLQSILLSAGKYTSAPAAPVAFPPAGVDEEFHAVLRTDECERAEDVTEVVGNPAGRVLRVKQPVRAGTVACYAENSRQLASLLNGLANGVGPTGHAVRGTMRLPGGSAESTTTYSEMLAVLGRQGFTVEVFSMRMFANFVGLSFKDGDTVRAIRSATSFDVDADVALRVPSEHGELDVIVHKDGKRYAEARWYTGAGNRGYADTITLWEARHTLEASWTQPLIEHAFVFPPEHATDAAPWFDATSRVMRGLNAVQKRYAPPGTSYGLFVCSDSVALAFSAYGEAQLRPLGIEGRAVEAFPLLRATNVFFLSRLRIEDVESEIATNASIDVAELRKNHPSDTTLSKAERTQRLLAAYRPEHDERLRAFPAFQASLAALRGR